MWINDLFTSYREFQDYVQELRRSSLLESITSRLNEAFAEVSGTTSRGIPYTSGVMKVDQVLSLYALVRRMKPEKIIETGVCNGLSSAIVLEALRCNGVGKLYSIDLPEIVGQVDGTDQFWHGKGGAAIPAGRQSGWVIPDQLRDRWQLHIGNSQHVLPTLLSELGKIDLFIHDGEHSYSNQIFEFRLAFEHLVVGGVLAASDINTSAAFADFEQTLGTAGRRYFVDDSLALIVRSKSNS